MAERRRAKGWCDHVYINGSRKPAMFCAKEEGHAGPHDFSVEGALPVNGTYRPDDPRPDRATK